MGWKIKQNFDVKYLFPEGNKMNASVSVYNRESLLLRNVCIMESRYSSNGDVVLVDENGTSIVVLSNNDFQNTYMENETELLKQIIIHMKKPLPFKYEIDIFKGR